MPKQMDEVLSQRESKLAVLAALETWEDREAAEELAEIVRPRGVTTDANWGAMPERAAAVADRLEAIAFRSGSVEAEWRLDTATMIRVRAGGPARRGGPFEWKRVGAGWTALGPTGTRWDVFGCELIVANWDRPDWSCASDGQAKRVAEEVDARPNYPKRFRVNEMPVTAETDDTRPSVKRGERSPNAAPDWNPETRDDPMVCRHCGSPSRAAWWKPRHGSIDWWLDPSGYWRCPECHGGRPDPNAPDPRLPKWPEMPGESPRLGRYREPYEIRELIPRRPEDL